MKFYPGETYHIYNRGNDKQTIFFQQKNYHLFLEKVGKYLQPNCEILAWCLMPNHFHFLIQATEKSCRPLREEPILVTQLVESFRLLLSSYSKAINVQERKTDNLFQQKTKSKNVFDGTDNYTITAFNYIHQNPLKAGLVNRLEDWEYSSFNEYAGSDAKALCNKELAIEMLDLRMDKFVEDSYAVLNEDLMKRIF